MAVNLIADPELIRKYGTGTACYRSYPTVDRFLESFDPACYRAWLQHRNRDFARPLALYVHLPPHCEAILCGATGNGPATTYAKQVQRELELVLTWIPSGHRVTHIQLRGLWPTAAGELELAYLMQRLRTEFDLAPRGDYAIEIDPTRVGSREIQGLRELGLNRLIVRAGLLPGDGADNGSAGHCPPEVEQAIDSARASGFRTVCAHIRFQRFGDLTAVEDAIDALISAGPDRILFDPRLALLPAGTKVWPRMEPELQVCAIDRIDTAGYIHIGMGCYARPQDDLAMAQRRGRICHDLRGYGIGAECDALPLGLGASGQIGRCYVQNQTSFAAYCAALDAGRPPILRGWEMSADDIVRRGVIQSLLCHCEVCFESISIAYLVDFKDYFSAELERLEPLVADGVVEVDDQWITVTPRGRVVVKAVCEVFDRYRSGA